LATLNKYRAKIEEMETGRSADGTQLVRDPALAQRFHTETLKSAKKEIAIFTSSQGLIELSKNKKQFEEWSKRGVSIKIMAPIVTGNLEATKQLLGFCEVRHVPVGYFETAIIDEQHLFQFKPPSTTEKASNQMPDYENTYYTNNSEYIQKTKRLLYDIWKGTRTPLSIQMEPADLAFRSSNISSSLESYHGAFNKRRAIQFLKDNDSLKVTEKDVLEKINDLRKYVPKRGREITWLDKTYMFCKTAFGVIYPPLDFGLPKLLIQIFKHDEDSSFGAESGLMINILLESSGRSAYVPAAYVLDNPSSISFRKKVLEGIPVGQNIQLLEEDQLKVIVHGTTLFAGWTKPIPLLFTDHSLPPCCIMFEGYGDLRSGMFKNIHPSGRMHEVWFNSYEAFITFFHPQSKYVGAGTEGVLDINSVLIGYPPKDQD